MPPNQQPIKFIVATEVATDPGFKYLSGNHSFAICVTDITEFKSVSGSCGNPAFNIPIFQSSPLGTITDGFEGPNDRPLTIEGLKAILSIIPMITIMKAAGMFRLDTAGIGVPEF